MNSIIQTAIVVTTLTLTGLPLVSAAEEQKLPATPHQAETLDDVHTAPAQGDSMREESESGEANLPSTEHQENVIDEDATSAADDDDDDDAMHDDD